MRDPFDVDTLRREIVMTWGPAGAHVEVLDDLLQQRDAAQASASRFIARVAALEKVAKAAGDWFGPANSLSGMASIERWRQIREPLRYAISELRALDVTTKSE